MWTNDPIFLYSEMYLNIPLIVLSSVGFNLEFMAKTFFYRKLTCADLKEKELLISCKNQCPKEVSYINKEILGLMDEWNFVACSFL